MTHFPALVSCTDDKPFPIDETIKQLRVDIRSNIQKINTTPLDAMRDEVARIRKILGKLENLGTHGSVAIDIEFLRRDFSTLATKFTLADDKNRKTWGLNLHTGPRYFQSPELSFEEARFRAMMAPSVVAVSAAAPVVELLNRPAADADLFAQLLSSITQETSNTRIFVQEPVARGGKRTYTLATGAQIAAPGCPRKTGFTPANNYTTTLANIIARNELGFTPQQVGLLVRKLIEVKADFSAIDYTGYPLLSPSMQNNPLKSLLALGSCNAHYDDTIVHLIRYIGSLPEGEKHKIFDHEDHYPFGYMSPVSLLIRQGKEDIVLHAIDCGIHVEEPDLLLACQSFGTTASARPNGIRAVEAIHRTLLRQHDGISQRTIEQCLDALHQASPNMVERCKDRLKTTDWLDEWSKQDTRNESGMAKEVREALGMDFETFKTMCGLALRDDAVRDRLLQTYAETQVLQSWPAGKELHAEFRTGGGAKEKYKFLTTAEGLKKHGELVTLLQKTPRPKGEVKDPSSHSASASQPVGPRGPAVVGMPVGIPRQGNGCAFISCAQFARHIPSLYRLTQQEHTGLKAFSDLFKEYDVVQRRGDGSTIVYNKNVELRNCIRALDPLISDAATDRMEDAHQILMAMMKWHPGGQMQVERQKIKLDETRPVITLDFTHHKNRHFSELFVQKGMMNDDTLGGAVWRFKEKPRELFLHLYRFKQTGMTSDGVPIITKDGDRVAVTPQLELEPGYVLTGEGGNYICDAFIQHKGPSMHGGHYVAYIKIGRQWFLLDDGQVTPKEDGEVYAAMKEAYIFHYAAI